MRHARADYNHIQDPSGKIPADEPVFLLRGQDILAPARVREWAEDLRNLGGSPELVQLAFDQAKRMEEWPAITGQHKLPDL